METSRDEEGTPAEVTAEDPPSLSTQGTGSTDDQTVGSPKGVSRLIISDSLSCDEAVPPKRLKVECTASVDEPTLQKVSEKPITSMTPPSTSPEIRPLARSPINTKSRTQQKTVGEQLKSTVSNWIETTGTMYQVKWLQHGGRNCPIVTQNENGPCPLIGIINVLFLRNKLSLPTGTLEISEDDLVEQVHHAIMETMPKDAIEHNPDQIQNLQDAVALLPQLRTGLNVNVKFSGVKNFEYTPECLIFDILGIHLYHGWLLDPQSTDIAAAIGNQSYNQLVESIIEKKTSKDPGKVEEALIAENFLEATASQLTVHGLCELNETLNKGELAILFRNNHFIVLYKQENMLCQLVTDQGFLDEPDVVWETLSTINGDEMFLDGSFRNSISKVHIPSLDPSEEQQISRDFLVALSLQDEQNKQQDKEFGWDAYGSAHGAIGMTSDEELARQLHVEEQRMAQASASRSGTPTCESPTEPKPSSSHLYFTAKDQEENHKPKDWKCIIS